MSRFRLSLRLCATFRQSQSSSLLYDNSPIGPFVGHFEQLFINSRSIPYFATVAAAWSSQAAAAAGAAAPPASVRKRDTAFIDRVRVRALGGHGGRGAVSFWKSRAKGKFVPADGGNGGAGGSVILRASPRTKSLAHVPKTIAAASGKPGGSQRRRGGIGADFVVDVPLGTVVHLAPESAAAESGLPSPSRQLHPQQSVTWTAPRDSNGATSDPADRIGQSHTAAAAGAIPATALSLVADLVADGDEVVVATGGAGGRGNASFRNLQNRPAPDEHEPGHPGEAVRLVLEMKLLADIGLVGFPNAGKSTLLRGVSHATPEVAAYPFTTLRPQLGTVSYSDGSSLTVADIPGLIEGAHANRGLGHAFLRHIQRTRALLFVLDLSGTLLKGGVVLPPAEQLRLLRRELQLYDPQLLTIPGMVVGNKIDKLGDPQEALSALRTETDLPVFAVSGMQRHGLEELCASMRSFAVS